MNRIGPIYPKAVAGLASATLLEHKQLSPPPALYNEEVITQHETLSADLRALSFKLLLNRQTRVSHMACSFSQGQRRRSIQIA